jgi:hypothetical protein
LISAENSPIALSYLVEVAGFLRPARAARQAIVRTILWRRWFPRAEGAYFLLSNE